jgi:hypothetical protein
MYNILFSLQVSKFTKTTVVMEEDFLPLNGTDHIEFYVGNARQSAHYYQHAFGFQLTSYLGPEIMTDAENQLKAMPGVGAVAMNLVWSPPWTPDRIEPRVRAYLGF